MIMHIDDRWIRAYIEGESLSDLKEHWVFGAIQEGAHLFEMPSEAYREQVENIHKVLRASMEHFEPMNKHYFRKMFKNYEACLEEMEVLLIVGCPSPYDAMFLEYEHKHYMVFDLIRWCEYMAEGYDIQAIARQLLTHEFAHFCIQKDYPCGGMMSYEERLAFITFDEGFAHLLAYTDAIETLQWEDAKYQDYSVGAKRRIVEALAEQDEAKQERWLEVADTGDYWQKYAAIAGKLYIGQHLDDIEMIYKEGPNALLESIVKVAQ